MEKIKFSSEGYLLKFLNVWGETHPEFRFVCESNRSKGVKLLTEEELKKEPLYKPRIYKSIQAVQAAIRFYDGGDECVRIIIPVKLEYKATGKEERV